MRAELAGLSRLRLAIREYPSVLVAYSGGVDSALVMAVAHDELKNKALACIGRSASLAANELRQALDLAARVGFAWRIVETFEINEPDYAENRGDRCYFCKKHLFEKLTQIARMEGWAVIADGVHADDAIDHQQGMRAAGELGVRSPLLEAGLGKEQIRAIASELGLPVWNKPASPCLASRVAVGLTVTAGRLGQIEAAEQVLAQLAFTDVRVRHHGDVARIEIPPEQFPRALQMRRLIVEGVGAAGFAHVTLDLAGRINIFSASRIRHAGEDRQC